MSHIRLELDEYALEFGGGKFIAYRHGKPWRNIVGDNLILALMTRIIELQRVIASNRSDESSHTADEWAIAEQRACEAKMEDDDE